MRTWTGRRISLVVAGLLVIGAIGSVIAVHRLAHPPVSVAAAGLSGEVHVMPARDVAGFLRAHGVPTAHSPGRAGTAVVARVSWTWRGAKPDDEFTAMLADRSAADAGVFDESYGVPDRDVRLDSGSLWDATTRHNGWLTGDGPREHSGATTSYGQFASLTATHRGSVWLVGRIVVPESDADAAPARDDAPRPVLGVALDNGQRVWWVTRLVG